MKEKLIYQVFNMQKEISVLTRKRMFYRYDELLLWALSQDIYLELFAKWKDSGYKKMYMPKISRIQYNGNYSLGNLYIHNNIVDTITKTKKIHKRSRIIEQYDLDGNYINEYESISIAAVQSGIGRTSIYHSVNDHYPHGGGYVWKIK